MPITVTDHTAEERAKRRADLIRQADRETLRTITLPVGRPRRQIEVVRYEEHETDPTGDLTRVLVAVRYELAGDLELFGCDLYKLATVGGVVLRFNDAGHGQYWVEALNTQAVTI